MYVSSQVRRWGLLSVLQRVRLVTVGGVWWGGKYLLTGLIKRGVSYVLVGCTELVSICNDNVTVRMRR